LQAAAKKAGISLLEPVFKAEVVTPEEFMGSVVGDLNSKRGRIENIEDRANAKVIDAYVPLAEMFGYATQLRSLTQGRAAYSMEFSSYEETPAHVTAKITEARAKK
jgi:elongation factor G